MLSALKQMHAEGSVESFTYAGHLNDLQVSQARVWAKGVNSALDLLGLEPINVLFEKPVLYECSLDDYGMLAAPFAVTTSKKARIFIYLTKVSFSYFLKLPDPSFFESPKDTFVRLAFALEDFISKFPKTSIFRLNQYVTLADFVSAAYAIRERKDYVSASLPTIFEHHPSIIAIRGLLISDSTEVDRYLSRALSYIAYARMFKSNSLFVEELDPEYICIPHTYSPENKAIKTLLAFEIISSDESFINKFIED